MDAADPSVKQDYQREIFGNRVRKKFKHLKKWARRNGVECFRVFDRDIPEIPLALDIYRIEDGRGRKEDWVLMSLFERPYGKPEDEEERWLAAMKDTASLCLGIPPERILWGMRKRQRGAAQYEPTGAAQAAGIIREGGAAFRVALGAYVDTGFFLEQRKLRALVRSESMGKEVLNLFSYTCAFSVFAALGGARRVDSVDLSNTYLETGRRNFILNGLSPEGLHREDVSAFLSRSALQNRVWDLIILDPPVFSNSKMSPGVLDLRRDWPRLVNACLDCLGEGGVLYFSVHAKKFRFDPGAVQGRTTRGLGVHIREITPSMTSEDFARGRQPYRVWRFRAEGGGVH
ncbi:MAG: class I SAM-dependent methyltransferase [Spirochaetaceae bacterium]|jgi:23S rRNA (cytosine1962-C5)-methyltransferase|nr:class I SAM-dependent methyltransferase [Spirochaetaceae bacterium]